MKKGELWAVISRQQQWPEDSKISTIASQPVKTIEKKEVTTVEEKMNDYSCLVADHPSTIKQCEEVIFTFHSI